GTFQANTDDIIGSVPQVGWSPVGNVLYASGVAQPNGRTLVFAWQNGGRGSSYQAFPVAQNTISGIRVLPNGRVAVADMQPSLSLLDETRAVLWQMRSRSADFAGQSTFFKVSPDGKRVFFRF